MSFKGLVLIISVALIQLAGLYIFTRGFLLTRLSLPDVNDCQTCTLPATHKRAVFLIIDALRFDFISPNPPAPISPHHHNVLALPHELTVAYPHNSAIFEAHADPPTTTLQRIKGLTTGSLPTFVDMGSNFGGSTITEDSLVMQLTNAGKRVRNILVILSPS
jgi:GPI ethanolamine phosphate transferase 3 subunit O